MLHDAIQTSEQLSIEEEGISSPIAAQILNFCDDGDLFPDPLRGSDLSSCSASSNAFCYDDGNFTSDFAIDMDAAALSALLDSDQPPGTENHTLLPTTTYSSPPHPMMYPPSYLGDQSNPQLDNIMMSGYPPEFQQPMGAMTSIPAYEDDCLPPLPSMGYVDASQSSFVDPCSFYEGPVGFFGGMMVGLDGGMGPTSDLAEYQRIATDCGGTGFYGPESIHQIYSSGDLQVIGDGHHLLGGGGGSPATLPASDISALDETTFKVGRLSNEERKEKIHRYMKKRNERNFSKKIKYACRKTLADSRPRVRGRFAKNDEFGGEASVARPSSIHHEYDDDEEVVVKEEDMLDSSDILAHISGVNSFKYNYTLESWI